MSAASNRSKSDQDPSTWLPPYTGYQCQYVTYWIADKTRYQLAVDPTEETALSEVLAQCPDAPHHGHPRPQTRQRPAPRRHGGTRRGSPGSTVPQGL